VEIRVNIKNSRILTISFVMPALDKRTLGYLPKFIKELQNAIGGKW
jgi:hypothetical protein